MITRLRWSTPQHRVHTGLTLADLREFLAHAEAEGADPNQRPIVTKTLGGRIRTIEADA